MSLSLSYIQSHLISSFIHFLTGSVFADVTVEEHGQIVWFVNDFERGYDCVGATFEVADVEAPLTGAVEMVHEMTSQKAKLEKSRYVGES